MLGCGSGHILSFKFIGSIHTGVVSVGRILEVSLLYGEELGSHNRDLVPSLIFLLHLDRQVVISNSNVLFLYFILGWQGLKNLKLLIIQTLVSTLLSRLAVDEY